MKLIPTPYAGRWPWPPSLVLDVFIFRDFCNPVRGVYYPTDVVRRLGTAAAITPAAGIFALLDWVVAEESLGSITSTWVDRLMQIMTGYTVHVDEETALRAWPDTLTLARRHQLAPSQAAHIELARRFSLPLATMDATLRQVATAEGVVHFVP